MALKRNEIVLSANWRPRDLLLTRSHAGGRNGLWQIRALIRRIEGDNWLTMRADRVLDEEIVAPGAKDNGFKFASVINWSKSRRMLPSTRLILWILLSVNYHLWTTTLIRC